MSSADSSDASGAATGDLSTDHRRHVEHVLVAVGEAIDAAGHDVVDGSRHGRGGCVVGLLANRSRQLLQEERIAFAPGEDARDQRVGGRPRGQHDSTRRRLSAVESGPTVICVAFAHARHGTS